MRLWRPPGRANTRQGDQIRHSCPVDVDRVGPARHLSFGRHPTETEVRRQPRQQRSAHATNPAEPGNAAEHPMALAIRHNPLGHHRPDTRATASGRPPSRGRRRYALWHQAAVPDGGSSPGGREGRRHRKGRIAVRRLGVSRVRQPPREAGAPPGPDRAARRGPAAPGAGCLRRVFSWGQAGRKCPRRGESQRGTGQSNARLLVTKATARLLSLKRRRVPSHFLLLTSYFLLARLITPTATFPTASRLCADSLSGVSCIVCQYG